MRPPRAIPSEAQGDLPSLSDPKGKRRGLATSHTIRLVQLDTAQPVEIARAMIPEGTRAELEGAFRYIPLQEPLTLKSNVRYALLATTSMEDGDQFKSPDSFDGLSPIVHPDVSIIRSLLVRDGNLAQAQSIPAFSDLSSDHSRHRVPVGPTLRFSQP